MHPCQWIDPNSSEHEVFSWKEGGGGREGGEGGEGGGGVGEGGGQGGGKE